MKQYNILQALYKSFYSSDFYRDVARNWGVEVIAYLLLLLLISSSVFAVKLQQSLAAGFQSTMTGISEQVPDMVIKEGQVITPENKPYFIHDKNSDELFAIIDTSGAYQHLPQNHAKFLLTKDALIYLDMNTGEKIEAIPKHLMISINPTIVKEKVAHLLKWAWLMMLPILLFIALCYRLAQVLIYALFGKLFALIGGVTLSYFTILKLAIVSLTPSILLAALLVCLNYNLAVFWPLYFIISMVYLAVAVSANKV